MDPDSDALPVQGLLTAAQRAKVLELLSIGMPLLHAARCVGCAPLTITLTAAHDKQFAEDLDRAKHAMEAHCLECIRKAAAMPQHWRAGVWLLKRQEARERARRREAKETFKLVKRVRKAFIEAHPLPPPEQEQG
jgi:hypothetical protein